MSRNQPRMASIDMFPDRATDAALADELVEGTLGGALESDGREVGVEAKAVLEEAEKDQREKKTVVEW